MSLSSIGKNYLTWNSLVLARLPWFKINEFINVINT
jgi:hypothetical protein